MWHTSHVNVVTSLEKTPLRLAIPRVRDTFTFNAELIRLVQDGGFFVSLILFETLGPRPYLNEVGKKTETGHS